MMTESQIIEAIQDRLDEGERQCNSGWFWHNDGVVRGLLWALTGSDPGTHLFGRVRDIYTAMGARIKEVDGSHIHYALPGRPDSDLDECEICKPK